MRSTEELNIVHYLAGMPPLQKGGLPKYAISLMNCQKQMGYNIKIVVPGPFNNTKKTSVLSWKKFNNIQSFRIVNGLPVANGFGINNIEAFSRPLPVYVFEEWLGKYSIDVIHIHSLLGLPVEFLDAAQRKNIKIVMTTHDFFGLCPKIDMMKGEEFCSECDWSKCAECCKNAYSVKRLKFIQSDMYWWYCNQKWLFDSVHGGVFARVKEGIRKLKKAHAKSIEMGVVIKNKEINYEPLRLYYRDIFSYVDYFHFNSEQTAEIFKKCLDGIAGAVIDITNEDVRDNRVSKEYGATLQLGYIGGKVHHKGFYFMVDNLQKIYDEGRKDFICHTFMLEDTAEYPFIANHGQYKYGEQEKIFKLMDVLVVPSVCRETFGMVVLEAISNGVPVLVSEYVGAKTLVERFTGVGRIFRVQGESFTNIIRNIYDKRDILKEMNHEILNIDFSFDMSSHAEKIEKFYSEILKS